MKSRLSTVMVLLHLLNDDIMNGWALERPGRSWGGGGGGGAAAGPQLWEGIFLGIKRK